MVDKNQAVLNFLLNCPQLKNNKVFFQFMKAEDDGKQIIVKADDRKLDKLYIDGSILKRYTFMIVDYKSVSYDPLVKKTGVINENIDDMLDIQAISQWITDKADDNEYPDFGSDNIIDNMISLNTIPQVYGIDKDIAPTLVKYCVIIQIDYIDISKTTF